MHHVPSDAVRHADEGRLSRSLIPDDPVSDRSSRVVSDDGAPRGTEAATAAESRTSSSVGSVERPCSLEALDGSWYVEFTPKSGTAVEATRTHGVMRIESRTDATLRISGDVYVEAFECEDGRASAARPDDSLAIDRNWYPQFDRSKYSWYFRSRGASYQQGRVLCDVTQYVWDPDSSDFSEETNGGSLGFTCSVDTVTRSWLPGATLQSTGTATIGGTKFDLTAYKTAPYYRGCLIEVDAMSGREWIDGGDGGRRHVPNFSDVYASMGIELAVVVDDHDIPESETLTLTEIRRLLERKRSVVPEESPVWRLWALVGSRLGRYGTLGLMFDETSPYREGVALFFDPTLPDEQTVRRAARGEKLGSVPQAFVRTAVHEIGHGFNLYHPKADRHAVPVGTTIMNQTSDLFRLASSSTPFPEVATFRFHEHNRTSLVHSPDPQVRPQWKQFGYGHGESGTVPTPPSDLTSDRDTPQTQALDLELALPKTVCPGELVLAEVSLRNTSEEPQTVTSALNFAEDYLRFSVTTPDGTRTSPRSVIQLCTNRRTTTLDPAERLTGRVQLLYTNRGFTFERPGRYEVSAKLDLGRRVATADARRVLGHSPQSDTQLDLCTLALDDDVGRSIALGDVAGGETGEDKIRTIADEFTATDLGTAAAIVLSNAYSRDVRDLRRDQITKASDQGLSRYYLDCAVEDRSPSDVARIATAVVPPAEEPVPVIGDLMDRFSAEENRDESELSEARRVVMDFYEGTGVNTYAR